MHPEEEKEIKRIQAKLAKMPLDELERWYMASALARRLAGFLGVGLCLVMLYFPSWIVILPMLALLVITSIGYTVVADMQSLAAAELASRSQN